MHERTYNNTDKSAWGDGPWQQEPDKIQWVDEATELDCLIVRNRMGALCGYVGVPPGHPFHGAAYQDVDVEVHGGLTFSSSCDEDAPEGEGICHVPLPGRPADVWWLGFDCAHAFDYAPGMEARLREIPGMLTVSELTARQEVYRDVPYVREECARLASQVAMPCGDCAHDRP